MSFAVVDFETTGILPSYHHRVVEIGVTHVEDDGTISSRWETLINPERDLGPQRIHGIHAADVLDAPTFSDVAAEFEFAWWQSALEAMLLDRWGGPLLDRAPTLEGPR